MNERASAEARPVEAVAVADDSWSAPGRRRPSSDASMDITPMIDITFLLLIFFLVATRLDTAGRVQLPEARHGTAVSSNNAVIITIAQGSDTEARIYKGDTMDADHRFPLRDAARQEEEIAAYIDAQLNAPVPKRHILIKAERDVKHRQVARVARLAAEVADVPLYVAVLEVP